jgi:hypothetical protein
VVVALQVFVWLQRGLQSGVVAAEVVVANARPDQCLALVVVAAADQALVVV